MFTASDVGWVVGHSYIVYAPLLVGATTVLYEGKPVGTPDAGAFWRVVAEHRVKRMFTAPTAIRAIRKVDPEAVLLADHDLSSLQTLFLAGERLDPGHVRVGQREARCAGRRPLVADRDRLADRGQPARTGADADQARLGDGAGAGLRRRDPRRCTANRLAAGRGGAIAIRLPLPPGTLPTVWGDDAALRGRLSLGLSRLLPDRRRRISSTRTATCS